MVRLVQVCFIAQAALSRISSGQEPDFPEPDFPDFPSGGPSDEPDEPDPVAIDWLNDLKQYSGLYGSVAKLFEHNPDSKEPTTWKSHAWSNSFALVGSVVNLVNGFIGKDSTAQMVADLQKEIDGDMDKLQNDLNTLLQQLDEDFVKLFLAENYSKLRNAIAHLAEFSGSSKEDTDFSIFQQQMEPLNDRTLAWDAVVDCFLGTVGACPRPSDPDTVGGIYGSLLNSGSLHGATLLPQPAALSQFAAAHYTVLASSATAICTYDKIKNDRDGCPLLNLQKLQDVAQIMSQQIQAMKAEFWNQMGEDTLPSLIDNAVNLHHDEGSDGAAAIRDIVFDALNGWYYEEDMKDFFGFESFIVAIYKDITGGDAHWMIYSNGGMKFRYKGYNIFYDFSSDEGQGYSANDCQNSDSHEQADCLNNLHGANVWCLNDGGAFYSVGQVGTYYQEYGGGARVVIPGFDQDGSNGQPLKMKLDFAGNKSSVKQFDFEGFEGFAVPPPATAHMESRFVPARRQIAVGVTPGDVFQDFSNAFDTIGAVATLFGPEGEFVAILAGIVAQFFSLLGGLFGLSCPVCDALKELEKDVVNRIMMAKNTVDEIRNRIEHEIIANILSHEGSALERLNDLYDRMVQNSGQGPSNGPSVDDPVQDQTKNQSQAHGASALAKNKTMLKTRARDLDNPAQQEFVDSVGAVSYYIDSWQTLVDCLGGENLDCFLDGKSALQILAHDGKNWYRPVSIATTVQYYMQLLQQTAFAICSYDMLMNNDEECRLLPNWNASLQELGDHISDVFAEVRENFWNSMDADTVPQWFDESIVVHHDGGHDGAVAIRDTVSQEIDHYLAGSDNDETFSMNMLGFDAWAMAVYQDVGGFDHHCMSASGFKFRYNGYNVMYDFSSGTAEGYNAGDCQDGNAQRQWECLNGMHGAKVWALNGGWEAISCHGCFSQEYDGGARMVMPGYDNGGDGTKSKRSSSANPVTLMV